jgi:hypothetical protein
MVEIPPDINSALAEMKESSTPELPYSTDLPTTSCLLCHEDLWDMKTPDAFEHRITCLYNLSPPCCLVCKQSFTEIPEPSTEPNALEITSWEVHGMF